MADKLIRRVETRGRKWAIELREVLNDLNGEIYWRIVHLKGGREVGCGIRHTQDEADRLFDRMVELEKTVDGRIYYSTVSDRGEAMRTINVLSIDRYEMSVVELMAFPETPEGYQEAQKAFRDLIRESEEV